MANFRCPSASTCSTSSTQNVQTTAVHRSRGQPRRMRSVDIPRSEAAARNAARVARARRVNSTEGQYPLFVGNFPPDADKKELVARFRRFGKITSADIRCYGGVCMPTKRAAGSSFRVQRTRQYAILTFSTPTARSKALKLGGSVLRGYAVAVSLSVFDLPDIRELVSERVEQYRLRFLTPDAHRAKKSVLKSLDMEPTVLLDPNAQLEHTNRKRAGAVIFEHTIPLTVI